MVLAIRHLDGVRDVVHWSRKPVVDGGAVTTLVLRVVAPAVNDTATHRARAVPAERERGHAGELVAVHLTNRLRERAVRHGIDAELSRGVEAPAGDARVAHDRTVVTRTTVLRGFREAGQGRSANLDAC